MDKSERLAKYQERFDLLKAFDLSFNRNIAGCDEAGRGPLCGPVVAACVALPKDLNFLDIDDSKKLTEKRRLDVYPKIVENSLSIGVGIVDNKRIDEINILNATREAMVIACSKVLDEIDIDLLLLDAILLDKVLVSQKSLVGGDRQSLSIAAASIIAKVTRDEYMKKVALEYPQYEFERHKGYGTKRHFEILKEFGPSPIHRKTFISKLF